jgi:transcriptional regulator with XRE-family HTH domain
MKEIDIKQIRENFGYSQGTLADMLGVSIRTVQNWENGKVIPKTKKEFILSLVEGENASLKQRLVSFIYYKRLSQKKFEDSIGVSNGYVNSISKGIGADKLEKICSKYPELNRKWLLYGQGEMLNPIQQGGIHSIASAPHAISAVNSTVNAQGASCTPHAPANEICIVPEEVSELPDTDVYELMKGGGLNEAERLNAVGRYIRIDMYWRVREDAMMPRFMRGDILALAALPEGAMFPNGSPMVVDTRPFGFVFRRVYDAGDALDCRVANAESGYADTVMQKSQVIRLYRVVGMVRLGQ